LKLSARTTTEKPASRAERMRRGRDAALPLRIAFPDVQQIRLEFSFKESSAYIPTGQLHALYPPARAYFDFPCPHADCSGQFDLASIVRQTVVDHPHSSSGSISCSGSRTGARGSLQPCELHLVYLVTALI
jgi:hypothetical protein